MTTLFRIGLACFACCLATGDLPAANGRRPITGVAGQFGTHSPSLGNRMGSIRSGLAGGGFSGQGGAYGGGQGPSQMSHRSQTGGGLGIGGIPRTGEVNFIPGLSGVPGVSGLGNLGGNQRPHSARSRGTSQMGVPGNAGAGQGHLAPRRGVSRSRR